MTNGLATDLHETVIKAPITNTRMELYIVELGYVIAQSDMERS